MVFLQCFFFLCNLLVTISSVSPVLFLSFLGFREYPVRLSVSLRSFGAFPVSSSAPLLRPLLRLPVFSLLLSVLVLSLPPPGFPSAILGLGSVLGVATAPAVQAVASPLFCPFVSASTHAAVPAAPSSLSLHFFGMLRLWLLLPVFLRVFHMPRKTEPKPTVFEKCAENRKKYLLSLFSIFCDFLY